MNEMLLLAGFLAAFWGLGWAVVLWETSWGRFLRLRRTWITVVVGVGVDLLLAGLVLAPHDWLAVWVVVAASALGIVAFCLADEYRQHREDMADAGGR